MNDFTNACRILLLELYKLAQKSRLDEHLLIPEQVSFLLRVDTEDTFPVVDYLEEQGYIRVGHPVGKAYSWVKLAVPGMELVMDQSKFEQAFQTDEGEFSDRKRYADPDVTNVIHALQQHDDLPLKQFLSHLILDGGVHSTVEGVKALLDEVMRDNP